MSASRIPTERQVWDFVAQVPVATKDYGVRAIRPWGTQRALIREILAGIEGGYHQFVVLKSRQVGASTLLLLLTILWMWRFPGMQGLTVTDSEENKQYFRDLFLGMIDTLEAKAEGKSRKVIAQELL